MVGHAAGMRSSDGGPDGATRARSWWEPAGAVLWMGLTAWWAIGGSNLSLVELILTLALLVVVPVGLPLLAPVAGDGRRPHHLHRLTVAAQPLGAVPGTVAVLLEDGPLAGALALPWLAITGLVAIVALLDWWPTRSADLVRLGELAAATYLLVGGAWFVVSRLGWRPLDFSGSIVELTAVHFQYAGMASALIASRTLGALVRQPAGHSRRVGSLATAAILVAPPIVAAGFAFSGALQVLGAAVLSAGLITLAVLILLRVVPTVASVLQRSLLATSAAAVIVPMVLATQWALGQHTALPALSIPQMAATHGVANAVGFSLCGLIGWRLAPGPGGDRANLSAESVAGADGL